MDDTAALCYLTKMGCGGGGGGEQYRNEFDSTCIDREITVTAEWIPTHLNVTADRESRKVKDSSEWKLNIKVFHRLILRWGNPEIDLFASRTSHRLS